MGKLPSTRCTDCEEQAVTECLIYHADLCSDCNVDNLCGGCQSQPPISDSRSVDAANDNIDFVLAVAKKLCEIEGLDEWLAQTAVDARPSRAFLDECRAKGFTAEEAARGFQEYQEKCLQDLIK